MEDIVIAIIRDLPSTAVLVLFVWFTSKQFQQAIVLIGEHLKEINKLLESCIRGTHLSEKEKEIDRKLHHLSQLMSDYTMRVQKED